MAELEIASALQLRSRLAGENAFLFERRGVSGPRILMMTLSLAGPGSIAMLLATYGLLFGAIADRARMPFAALCR